MNRNLVIFSCLVVSCLSNEYKQLNMFNIEGVLDDSTFSTINVEEVNMKNCKFEDIDPNAFKLVPQMKKLTMESNTIDTIPKDAFSKCGKLEQIKIKRSKIIDIENEAFAGLPSLKYLSIEQSDIGNLSVDMFSSLSNLDKLECNKCGLKEVDPQAFNGLTNLTELCLQNNGIRSFSFAHFPNLPRLKSIDLSGNPLMNLDVTNIKEKCPAWKQIKLKGVNLRADELHKLQELNIKVK